MFATRHVVKQFDPLEMTVVLFAYLHLKPIKMALEGDSLIDIKLAEEKRGYAGALCIHDVSREIPQVRPLILTRLARSFLKAL